MVWGGLWRAAAAMPSHTRLAPGACRAGACLPPPAAAAADASTTARRWVVVVVGVGVCDHTHTHSHTHTLSLTRPAHPPVHTYHHPRRRAPSLPPLCSSATTPSCSRPTTRSSWSGSSGGEEKKAREKKAREKKGRRERQLAWSRCCPPSTGLSVGKQRRRRCPQVDSSADAIYGPGYLQGECGLPRLAAAPVLEGQAGAHGAQLSRNAAEAELGRLAGWG